MDQDTKRAERVVALRAPAVEFTRKDHVRERDLTPADGAAAQSGSNVSVFCAPCGRWIDCYDDIPPETVLKRHVDVIHDQ